MRNLYSMLALVLFTITAASAQTQRLVLLEHFSGASCGPCAAANPGVNAILNANPEKVVSIKYQLAPPGVDPMYSHNSSHSNARASYYAVSGIPRSVIDGNHFSGHPANWNLNTINARYAVPSPFSMAINYEVTPTVVNVTVSVTATQDFNSSNLRLHTVVIEKNITFDSPPGSNGETSFSHVMKRMLPSQNGTNLPSTWTAGQTETFELSWNHQNVYNLNQLAVVAFVQNNSTKEVHQAAVNYEATFSSPYSVALQTANLGNLPGEICANSQFEMTPRIKVTNMGSSNLTSLDVVTTVNGQQFTMPWTGVLGTFEYVTINISAITATSTAATNNVSVQVTNPNSTSNELSINPLTATFPSSSVETTNTITLSLTLDCYPTETTWRFVNIATGAVVAQGGPYPNNQAFQTVNQSITLPADACYLFRLLDSFGDGLNGAAYIGCNSNGSVTVTDNLGNQIFNDNGTTQWYERNRAFKSMQNLSNSEADFSGIGGLNVFPNPSSGIINLQFEVKVSERITYSIVNYVGQVVGYKDLGLLPAGEYLVVEDLSQFSEGIYFVVIETNQGRLTRKLIVSK